MLRKIIVPATIAVALFAGTAVAVAAPTTPDVRTSSVNVEVDHSTEMDTQWPEMLGFMEDFLGGSFTDMVDGMQIPGFDMNGFDMGSFDMGGFDMTGFDMGSFDMGGFDMTGFDMGGFGSNGSGMGGQWGGMHG